MGTFPSLKICPVRPGILRNAGDGSRNFSTLEVNRKAKPSARMGQKAMAFESCPLNTKLKKGRETCDVNYCGKHYCEGV